MTEPEPEQTRFVDLVRKVRLGDQEAAAELVRTYEPEIRREVRLRMRGRALRRVVDSMDIAQSVLRKFFVRAAVGEFELHHPKQLIRLLVTMTKNQVTDWARRMRVEQRDRVWDEGIEGFITADRGPRSQEPTPSAVVAGADLLSELRKRMTATERRIAELRAADKTWEEIGAELDMGPHAVRKRLTRARERIEKELDVG